MTTKQKQENIIEHQRPVTPKWCRRGGSFCLWMQSGREVIISERRSKNKDLAPDKEGVMLFNLESFWDILNMEMRWKKIWQSYSPPLFDLGTSISLWNLVSIIFWCVLNTYILWFHEIYPCTLSGISNESNKGTMSYSDIHMCDIKSTTALLIYAGEISFL